MKFSAWLEKYKLTPYDFMIKYTPKNSYSLISLLSERPIPLENARNLSKNVFKGEILESELMGIKENFVNGDLINQGELLEIIKVSQERITKTQKTNVYFNKIINKETLYRKSEIEKIKNECEKLDKPKNNNINLERFENKLEGIVNSLIKEVENLKSQLNDNTTILRKLT